MLVNRCAWVLVFAGRLFEDNSNDTFVPPPATSIEQRTSATANSIHRSTPRHARRRSAHLKHSRYGADGDHTAPRGARYISPSPPLSRATSLLFLLPAAAIHSFRSVGLIPAGPSLHLSCCFALLTNTLLFANAMVAWLKTQQYVADLRGTQRCVLQMILRCPIPNRTLHATMLRSQRSS